MPFVAVPGVIRVAMVFQDTSGNEAVNVIHVKDDNDPTTLNRLTTLSNILAVWASAEWAPMAAQAWQLNRVELRSLDTADGLYLVSTLSIQGQEEGQAMPSQNTIAVSLRSPFTGRSRRGRLYFVGLSEVAVNGDYLVGTSRTVIISAYEQLRDDLNAGEFVWVVVSYTENKLPRVTPLITPVSSIIITDDVIDSMDKRKPRS